MQTYNDLGSMQYSEPDPHEATYPSYRYDRVDWNTETPQNDATSHEYTFYHEYPTQHDMYTIDTSNIGMTTQSVENPRVLTPIR